MTVSPADETTPLTTKRVSTTNVNQPLVYNANLGYYSDSAIHERAPRHDDYQNGMHFHKTGNISSDDDNDHSDDETMDHVALNLPTANESTLRLNYQTSSSSHYNHIYTSTTPTTRRSQSSRAISKVVQKRNINKRLKERSLISKLRVSAYCTCEHISIFKLLKWLERVENEQLAGGELNPKGWDHSMYPGAVHSMCVPEKRDTDGSVDLYRQKDVFYFSSGIAVFWGFTRQEEKIHLQAMRNFSVGFVKQIEVEDMDFCYGDTRKIVNDAITLASGNPLEKLAYSFAMAQSAKLDIFEERVEDTIKDTKHIPQNLATTGSIKYSQNDISKLIGRLFIERNDVNLNSNMLDTPEFFWEYDEWEPLYKKMLRYLDVDNRVAILNSRLDILRELLDVLSQQLAHQHDTKLEWIIIWLILAEVAVQIVWNILIKDILGYFPTSSSN